MLSLGGQTIGVVSTRNIIATVLTSAALTFSCASSGSDGAKDELSAAVGSSEETETGTPSTRYVDDRDFTYAGEIAAPDIPNGLDWFNVERPLSLVSDLRGKIVILDFWTQGCINCLHVIPDLHRLEEEYPAG